MEKDEEKISQISQPSLINIHLFLHQLKSIEVMTKWEKEKEIDLTPSDYITTKVGVLADLPGYGKSLSTLGLIGQTLSQIDPDTVHTVEKIKHYAYVKMTKTDNLTKTNCSLILVNISLLSQWMCELNRTLCVILQFIKRPISKISI